MNPFGGYGAIVTGDRLVGRGAELEFLVERLSQACGSISVIGEPRVGKSSLVNTAADCVRAANAKMPVVWLDVSTLPSSQELFSGIFSEILQSARDGIYHCRPTSHDILRQHRHRAMKPTETVDWACCVSNVSEFNNS